MRSAILKQGLDISQYILLIQFRTVHWTCQTYFRQRAHTKLISITCHKFQQFFIYYYYYFFIIIFSRTFVLSQLASAQ